MMGLKSFRCARIIHTKPDRDVERLVYPELFRAPAISDQTFIRFRFFAFRKLLDLSLEFLHYIEDGQPLPLIVEKCGVPLLQRSLQPVKVANQ